MLPPGADPEVAAGLVVEQPAAGAGDDRRGVVAHQQPTADVEHRARRDRPAQPGLERDVPGRFARRAWSGRGSRPALRDGGRPTSGASSRGPLGGQRRPGRERTVAAQPRRTPEDPAEQPRRQPVQPLHQRPQRLQPPRQPAHRERLEQGPGLARGPVPRERRRRARAAPQRGRRAQRRGPAYGVRERLRRPGRRSHGMAAGHLGGARVGAHHDGLAHRHRLDHGQPEPLEVGREHDAAGAGQHRVELRVREERRQLDPRVEPEVGPAAFQLRPRVRVQPDDDERRVDRAAGTTPPGPAQGSCSCGGRR